MFLIFLQGGGGDDDDDGGESWKQVNIELIL